jgi:VRR-NUC domain
MLEETLQAQVIELAGLLGFMHYHPYDSRRSVPGFPDLTLVHEQTGALVFAELKSDSGQVTPEQDRWLTALGRRHTAEVWRPRDLRAGAVAHTLQRAVRAAS